MGKFIHLRLFKTRSKINTLTFVKLEHDWIGANILFLNILSAPLRFTLNTVNPDR